MKKGHTKGLSRNIVVIEELREALNIWLQLGTRLNGARWMKPGNIKLAMQGYTDSSSRQTTGIFAGGRQQEFIYVQRN